MSYIDFKKLQEYPLDIHNFNYDVEAMVNNIYVGPQGELLERLNRFNTRYATDLEITKNFTLKPGGYNKLKDAYGKWILRWDMKPNGISSIFKRAREYGWRFNGFKDDAENLERTMMGLRSAGLQWQDNADDLGIELEKIKAIIINSLENCKQMYPNVAIEVKMIPMRMDRSRSDHNLYGGRRSLPELSNIEDIPSVTDYCVTFVMYLKDPTMTIHILCSDETVEQVETKCGDIIVASGASLLQMIGRSWGREILQDSRVTSRNNHYYLEAIYLSNMKMSKHPYIGKTSDAYAYEIDGRETYCGNICTGNMADEFKSTIINSQIDAHITYLVTWLTNYYIPQTNPLNRIKLLKRYGQDKQFGALAGQGERYNAFDVIMDPEQCGFGVKLAETVFDYAKRQPLESYNPCSCSVQPGTDEYNKRILEYLQHIDIDDFPCNTCTHNMDCDHQTNVMLLFRLEALKPMEEAYIGMFLEMHELDARLNNRKPIVFVEQLVYDVYRWRVDEEYDKLIQCNYIAQIFNQNEADANTTMDWSNPSYLSIMTMLWSKTDYTVDELYKVYNMNNGCNWDWDRLAEFDLGNPEPTTIKHTVVNDMDQTLEDLTHAVLTPEEMTLRWASRNGGANNL